MTELQWIVFIACLLLGQIGAGLVLYFDLGGKLYRKIRMWNMRRNYRIDSLKWWRDWENNKRDGKGPSL